MTMGLRCFAVFAQLILIGLGLAALSLLPVAPWVAALVVATEAACFVYLLRVLDTEKKSWPDDFRIHLILLLMPPLLVFLPQLDPPLRLALMLACFPPLFLLDSARAIAGKVLARLRES